MLSGTLFNSNKFHPLKKSLLHNVDTIKKTPANKNNFTFQQIITFFIGYFPSPSVCHKSLMFCWKLLRTINYSLKQEKLIITFFQEKNEKMWICYNWYTGVGKSHATSLVYCVLHTCMLVIGCHGNALFKLFHYHLQHHCRPCNVRQPMKFGTKKNEENSRMRILG